MRSFKIAVQCLLLTAVLILNLCACQSNGDYANQTTIDNATEETTEAANPISGVWKWKLDITQACNEQYSEEVGKYLKIKELYYIVVLELGEDGRYSLTVDEAAYQPVRERAVADVKEGMAKYLEAMLKADGVNMTVDEYMQYRGTTMDEYAESIIKNLDPQEMGFNSIGYYKAESGKLYMGISPFFDEEDASDFTLEGDKLSIKEGLEGLFDSMEFERVE